MGDADEIQKALNKFRELTCQDAENRLAAEIEKLKDTSPVEEKDRIKKDLEGFQRLFLKYLQGSGPSLVWEKIKPHDEQRVVSYDDLARPSETQKQELLSKLVVVKLNGGLGTSMGCTGPKSIIPVRSDLTFLDLTVQQIQHLNKTYNTNIPLVLMNSFNTEEETKKVLRKYSSFQIDIHTFMQSKYPRINKESLMPIATTLKTTEPEGWYPPGHGDFYESFHNSGLLNRFIKEGKEYCFISNIDNLGATVDLQILNCFFNPPPNKPKPEFLMEVTDKTNADVKGGTLINYEDKLCLLEIAQVPKEHVDEFKSVKKFKIFNTNNLWMNLKSIQRLVTTDALNMEVIVNHKHLDNGLNVIQLETAAGAAMRAFTGAMGINVKRDRFLPVKKTSDLLLVKSNLYSLQEGSLKMNPARPFATVPLVKLGDRHFSKVQEFIQRFASIPDMLELDHLTVSGDVTFGRGVTLKGTVIIIANQGERIDIPSGAILDNKIVSGNLRILDH